MKHAAWIVGFYLFVDLVAPGLPGAFCFETETSIEVARAQRSPRAHLPMPADVTPPASLDSRDPVRFEEPVVPARTLSGHRSMVPWPPPLRAAAEPVDVDPSEAA